MAGPDGPCPPLTDQQNVNTIIITIIAIFLNRSEQDEWRETSHWTTSFPCPNSAAEGPARRPAGWGTTTPSWSCETTSGRRRHQPGRVPPTHRGRRGLRPVPRSRGTDEKGRRDKTPAWTTCSARNTSPSMTAMSRSSNDGLGHRIHRGATRRIKRSWRSRRVSAVGRTGRSDAEDGVNHGPWAIQDGPVHDQAPPCGPWAESGTLDQGQMDHVDAGGPPTCPARFRSTSCEWTNGPHAGPIMRPTRRTM